MNLLNKMKLIFLIIWFGKIVFSSEEMTNQTTTPKPTTPKPRTVLYTQTEPTHHLNQTENINLSTPASLNYEYLVGEQPQPQPEPVITQAPIITTSQPLSLIHI